VNPWRIEATNFRSWERIELDLPQGCCAVIGRNGAGKSSLLALIETCLFGGRWERLLRRGATEMEITLWFDHAGRGYRVRRHFSARARGKSATDFEQLDEATKQWVSLAAETQAATQERIAGILGVSQQTWRASAYLAQGDSAAFTDAKPAERKDILGDVLGLGIYDDLAARARDEAREMDREQTVYETRLLLLEAAVERIPGLEAELEAAGRSVGLAQQQVLLAETVTREYEQAQAKVAAAQEVKAAVAKAANEASARHAKADAAAFEAEKQVGKLEALDEARRTLPTLEAERDGYQQDMAVYEARVKEMDAVKRDIGELVRQGDDAARRREAAKAEGRKINQQLQRTEATGAICPTCGQPVAGDARTRARASLEERLTELRSAYEQANQAATACAQARDEKQAVVDEFMQMPVPAWDGTLRLDEARKAEEAFHQAQGMIAGLAALKTAKLEAAAEVDEKMEAYRDADDALAEAVAVLEHTPEPKMSVETARETEAEVQATFHRVKAALEASWGAKAESDGIRTERDGKLADQKRMAMLAEAFGRNGIPAMIVENAAIPSIEAEADRILDALGTSYRVELRSQRPLKSGEGMRETLDIVVAAPAGEAFYEDFSGGEKTKLNLALRIALARLLANRRGADVRLLAIDEPEYLDDGSVERLAGVLHELGADFDRILLVSHVPALRDAFDQVIEVSRDEDAASVLA
jgi:DNA repair protein SbcC/Rad50